MLFHRSGLLILVVLVAGLLLSCGVEEVHHHDCLRQSESELRPTDPSDPSGYEGAETDTLISPEGYVRVWWATEGPHQPPTRDSNDSGIPDYVELTAQIADEVAALLEYEGWRLPLTAAPEEPLDLFLVNFTAGDGNFRTDNCYLDEGTPVCSGHLRIENDFQPLYYPTQEYALRVVISHEFFHAVQYAYHAEMPPWWAEGGATWFQEYFWEEQQDFERLTDFYFDEHERSLHDRQRGAFDAYAYGAAIFVYFLEQQIGAEGIQRIHQRMAENIDVIEAIDEILTDEFAPLQESFPLFAVWNLFTGERAIEGQGYPDGERFAEISQVELDADQAINWNVGVDPLAVQYARVDATRDVAIKAEPIDGHTPFDIYAVAPAEFEESGVYHHITAGADQAVTFEADAFPIYLVAVNADVDDLRSVQIQLRRAAADDVQDDETPQEIADTDGASGCTTAGQSPATPLLILLALAALPVRPARRNSPPPLLR